APALREIEALLERGRHGEAEILARRLVAAHPLLAPAHYTLGIVLQGSGRFELAEPSLARAVTLDERNLDYLLNYGLCLLSMGRVAEAAPLYERARAFEPRNFVTLWRMGSFRARIGHMDEALALYDKALHKAPEAARCQIRLEKAECLLSLGRIEDARALMLRDLATTPHRARYLCLLSGSGRDDAGSALYGDICAEIERPGLAPQDRCDLMIRKGVMLQASGRFDEAFATLRDARKLLRTPSVTAAFGREVDERITAFTRERIEALSARYGRSRFRPIFVVGLPRSGTTLAAQILSAHSTAGNAGELETFTYVAARLAGGRALREIDATLDALGSAKIEALAQLYQQSMDYVVNGHARPVDKMPLNFRFLAEIAVLFPDARIVHCTRHPADTFISAFQTEMNLAHAYSYDPASYADYFRDYQRLMAHWDKVLPGRVVRLSYEDLVASPETAIRALLASVDLPFEAACLNPERNMAPVSTFSRLQVRAGINANSVGRWKPYAAYLEPILQLQPG
ncbi:tetratricopeptide repeat protein, partial [Aestuariivirga sp.]|uniref:tetratricopeptide repeat protein n=1 Tax=Aestuariivirga sp. TaxID=2650926 RepID=UPI0037848781